MKVKKVIGTALFTIGIALFAGVGALPLFISILAFVTWAHLERMVDLQQIAAAAFVANIMCMAAGLYLINKVDDTRR